MKRALVLSGGGAKGAYEIGAYKALRKLGYKFDIITGTSIGALNAAILISGNYRKAYRIWRTITTSDLFDVKKDITEKEMYKVFFKEFFKNQGLSFSKAESYIRKNLSEEKIRKSKIDFGIVTYSLSSKRPRALSKKNIPEGKLIDYVIASSTCFPAVATKKIGNETFIDGGFCDNMPIDLAIEMGATNIVAIDLSVLAFEKKVKNTNVYIDIIKCPNKKIFTIDFTHTESKKYMEMGYNDTLKYYQKLDGQLYTFKHLDLKNNYKKIEKSYINILTSILMEPKKSFLSKELFSISKYEKLFTDIKQQRSIEQTIDESLEYLGELFELDKNKIYKISKYDRLLLKNMDKLKDIKINNKLKGKMLISYIYNKYTTTDNNDKLAKELYNIALLFKKEFLAAIYLITISNKYKLALKTEEFYNNILQLLKKNN